MTSKAVVNVACVLCNFNTVAGIIDCEYTYVDLDSTEGDVFQVATMDTPELVELMNMYNRSCSHIDFKRLLGPSGTLCLLVSQLSGVLIQTNLDSYYIHSFFVH